VEVYVAYVGARSQRHTEGLNRTIEIHVIQRVLVVPDSRSRVRHLIAHKPDAIVTRIRLNLIYCGTRPSHDGRLHLKGQANRRKCEKARATAY